MFKISTYTETCYDIFIDSNDRFKSIVHITLEIDCKLLT